MKKLMRIILLCFLVLILPIKSISAASTLGCDLGHHTTTDLHDQNDHHASEFSNSDSDHQTTSDHIAKEKCNCGSCCVNAMLTTFVSFPSITNPSSEKIAFIFSSHIGHISDGLERPPKSST